MLETQAPRYVESEEPKLKGKSIHVLSNLQNLNDNGACTHACSVYLAFLSLP